MEEAKPQIEKEIEIYETKQKDVEILNDE